MAETDSNVPEFHGDFTYGIDQSRRLMVPSRWRPKDPHVLFTMILWPIAVEDCLLVMPPEPWKAMMTKLKTQATGNEGLAALERVLGSTSTKLTLDKVGRLCLPENLTAAARITDKAQFVGRIDKFELWNPDKRTDASPQDKALAAQFAKQIGL